MTNNNKIKIKKFLKEIQIKNNLGMTINYNKMNQWIVI